MSIAGIEATVGGEVISAQWTFNSSHTSVVVADPTDRPVRRVAAL